MRRRGPDFLAAIVLLLDIFIVGTGHAKGVPLPVVKRTICAPALARAVAISAKELGHFKI